MEYKEVYAWEVFIDHRKGMSFDKIAEKYNTHKGVVYRLYKKAMEGRLLYCEKIGSKSKNRFKPIWKWIEPEKIYNFVFATANKFADMYTGICRETLVDFLLNFAYTLDLSKIKNPSTYLWRALQRKCLDFIKKYEVKYSYSIEEYLENSRM